MDKRQLVHLLTTSGTVYTQILSLLGVNETMVIKKISDMERLIETSPSLNHHHITNSTTTNTDQSLKCHECGNSNRMDFTENKNGEVICLGQDKQGCGSVIYFDDVYQGPSYRVPEHSSHGALPSILFSSGYNLGTMINKGILRSGTSGPSSGTSKYAEGGREIDIALSATDRLTREEWKDDQKQVAFAHIKELTAKLEIHSQIKERACELFAIVRNNTIRLHHYNETIAASIIIAHIEFEDMTTVHQIFECFHCGLTFQSKFELSRHMKIHDHDTTVTSPSNIINISSYNRQDLVKLIHSLLPEIVHQHTSSIVLGIKDTMIDGVTFGQAFLTTTQSQLLSYCNGDHTSSSIIYNWIKEYKRSKDLEKLKAENTAKERRHKIQDTVYKHRLGLIPFKVKKN